MARTLHEDYADEIGRGRAEEDAVVMARTIREDYGEELRRGQPLSQTGTVSNGGVLPHPAGTHTATQQQAQAQAQVWPWGQEHMQAHTQAHARAHGYFHIYPYAQPLFNPPKGGKSLTYHQCLTKA
eukprot:comp5737_c0_seq1/m.1604 comp5737_c0_seq1/g.1604  ORF comp5737_c0_seq1/g.1604 comp5737_c0_seq1/m.1604 type:complete len:126 (-) comp5737_c0_seq1:362-739(-)